MDVSEYTDGVVRRATEHGYERVLADGELFSDVLVMSFTSPFPEGREQQLLAVGDFDAVDADTVERGIARLRMIGRAETRVTGRVAEAEGRVVVRPLLPVFASDGIDEATKSSVEGMYVEDDPEIQIPLLAEVGGADDPETAVSITSPRAPRGAAGARRRIVAELVSTLCEP